MDDGQWQAPGREQPRAGGGDEPYAPADRAEPTGPYAAPPVGRPAPGASGAATVDSPFATSERHRDRVLAGSGYDSPAYRNDSVAVTAMVLGIIGVIIPGVCLLAIAFGHLGLRRLRTSYEGGRGLAVAGLALGYAMTAVWIGIALLFLSARTLL